MFELPRFGRRKSSRIRSSLDEIEVQDVFLDKMTADREEEEGEDRRIEAPLSAFILKAIFSGFLLLVILFGSRTLILQAFSHERMSALAARNAVREVRIPANRGIVYDREMRQLVENAPSFDLVCDRRDISADRERLPALLLRVAQVLGLSYDEVRSVFESGSELSILFAKTMSHDQIVRTESLEDPIPGCKIEENARREYPFGPLLAHVLGYTGSVSLEELKARSAYSVGDQIGKSGIEQSMEGALRGEPGIRRFERDARGGIVKELDEDGGLPGKNVVLSLDVNLQQAIWDAMDRTFEQTGTNRGAAVALDPSTGEVLALVSRPGFDPSIFSRPNIAKEWEQMLADTSRPLFNRAISGIGYPPGSVIKPLVALAALEEGIITENRVIYSPLELCIWNKYAQKDECFPDWTFHGFTDVKRAIAESVNTFFYIVGGGYEEERGLGAEAIKEYLERFGWGAKTGIDIAGEGEGILPSLESGWRLGDTYHFSIGQGPMAVTPVQVAAAFAAVANGGRLLEPRLVQGTAGEDGGMEEAFAPRIIREEIADPDSLRVVREGMRRTVTAGSATGWLDALPVSVAAKTGTAQTGRKDSFGRDYLTSWVVAFAPFDNPRIVFTVVIENAKEGTISALPVARDALSTFFSSP